MPNSPLRQVIIDAIKARFTAITPGATYTNDLTDGKVFEWKPAPFEDDELPGINIMDGDEKVEDASLGAGTMGKVWSRVPIMVSAAVKVAAAGSTTATVAAVARTLQADLAKAVGNGTPVGSGWGLNGAYSVITGVGLDVQSGDKHVAYAYVEFEVVYQHPRFDYGS